MTAAPHIVEGLRTIWSTLTRAGVPPQSAFWQREDERFYRHETADTQCANVGRAGDKSRDSTVCDVAEVLCCRDLPPVGERYYHTRVSENRDEAAKSLTVLQQYLRILGVAHTRTGDTIDLESLPLGFKVLACRVGAVSGWRSIGWTADEVAKWSNDGPDPSAEMIASMDAMTANRPEARKKLRSSPLAMMGLFYEMWSTGDTADVVVCHAPSWEANPSISREHCIKLARGDMRIFRREYEAIPQSAALAAFDADAIDRAFALDVSNWEKKQRVLILDPSSGKSDSWTWGVAGWTYDERNRYERRRDGVIRTWPWGDPVEVEGWKPAGPPVLQFDLVDGVEGRFWDQVSGDDIVERLVALARRNGIRDVHSDQRESLMLRSAFERAGLRFFEHAYSATNKPAAVETIRRWLREGKLALPLEAKGASLRRELLAFEERLTPSGQFTFRGRGTTHDDYAALTLTAALAELENGLPLSPIRRVPVPGWGMGQNSILPF